MREVAITTTQYRAEPPANRQQAGGNQGAQEAFQDEKAEAKAAPDVKISPQTTVSSLEAPPATSADGVTVSDPHPPNLW